MTKVEIASLALNLLGTKGISSFEDDSDEARLCTAFYGPARDALLEERVWTFATKRLRIVPHAEAPAFGYLRQFEIPAVVARVHRVDGPELDGRLDWRREGKFILSDATEVYITAVVKEDDSSLYSPAFCLALAAKLATLICIPLSENTTHFGNMVALADKYLKDAAGTDGAQGRSERIRSSNSIADRR